MADEETGCRSDARGDAGPATENANALQFTLEEIIEYTARTLNLRNEKPKHAEIATLIPEFYGRVDEDVDMLFQKITTIKETYKVDDKVLTLAMV